MSSRILAPILAEEYLEHIHANMSGRRPHIHINISGRIMWSIYTAICSEEFVRVYTRKHVRKKVIGIIAPLYPEEWLNIHTNMPERMLGVYTRATQNNG
jgi:hypothetical protein